MAARTKRFWMIVVIATAMAAGVALYYFFLRDRAPAPDVDTMGQAQPPTEATDATYQDPYEFVWREGDIRGVDVPTKVRIASTGKVVPIHLVQDMTSNSGEAKIEFLHRVREVMVAYSDKQSHEACGEICSDGSTHSIRITTNAAVTRCAVAPICMEGQATTLESIHSHCPSKGSPKATQADEDLSEGVIRKGMRPARCDTERFSSMDMAGRRPAWLAGRRALHQHDGPARITRHDAAASGEKLVVQGAMTAN